MNYLAHAFLSCLDSEILIGNLMTDLMSFEDRKNLPEAWKSGMLYHHWIDDFADSHPANLEAKSILRKHHGKFAPVTLDIFQDFLLCRSWQRWTEHGFEGWKSEIYNLILDSSVSVNFVPWRRLCAMAENNWIDVYRTREGIESVFSRLAQRKLYDHPFAHAMEGLELEETQLVPLFAEFFEDILAQSQEKCKGFNSAR